MAATIAKQRTSFDHPKNGELMPIGNKTKAEVYGWVVKDCPGKYMLLDKKDLKIDLTYQREDISNVRVLEIARDYSWLAFGVLIVAEREDGYYVIEGQHRLLAARKHAELSLLPCLVFSMVSIEEEARGFYDINKKRKAISSLACYRAALVAHDPVILHVDSTLKRSGYYIGSGPGAKSVGCINSVVKVATENRELFDRIWPLIVAVHRGSQITHVLFQALVYIEAHMPDGQSLTDKYWTKRLLNCHVDDLIHAAKNGVNLFGSHGARSFGLGALVAINRKHSEAHRLVLERV